MSNKALAGLAILAIAGIGAYKFYFKKSEPIKLSKYNSYLSCSGTPTDLKISANGEIYFLKSALPEVQQEKDILFGESIVFQNLYPFMNLGNMNNILVNSSNLSRRPKIKVLSVTDAEYPFNAAFESQQEIYFFHPAQQNYLNKVLPMGKIQKGEPAIKVTYEYANDLHLCMNGSDTSQIPQIEFLRPKDPFFAYFAVAPEERRPMTNKFLNEDLRINPCMGSDAIAGGSIAPFALWYHWLPRAKGVDNDNKPFDCTAIYNENVIDKVTVNMTENPEKSVQFFKFKEFENLERPIRASLVFGANNNYNFEEFKEEEVTKLINLYLSGLSQEEAIKNLPITNKKYDSRFSSMLIVIWNLAKHIKLHSIESDIDKFHTTVYIRGKLNLSKKDIEVKFTVARNKPGKEGAEYFDKSFASALVKDDIVVYFGHAGYGATFQGALDYLKGKKAELADSSLKYQVLAVLSCSSEHYFTPEMFPKPSDTTKRDIVSAGGGYNDPTSQATLALIASLDSYLYNESYVPFGLWSKQFKTDNFLILTNN